MAKFHAPVGFVKTEETSPGVFLQTAEEHYYKGDVIRESRRWEKGENLNDDLSLNNRFSIVADRFAFENTHNIGYILYMGTKWKVTSVEVKRPRLILSVGGVYNA